MQSRTEDILQAMIDGTDSSELAPPQSRVEVLLQRILDKMNAGGGGGGGLPIHICTQDEYDAMTRVPTIQNPDEETLYLVPSAGSSSGNLFNEWIYVDNSWELVGSASIDVPVTDVQVNGSTIVNNGVANVPVADSNTLGVIKLGNSFYKDANNTLKFDYAGSATVKSGSTLEKAIVPYFQDHSVFYGLAKAAGADMASLSGITVGQYPEAQKSAIQNMLGVANKANVDGSYPNMTVGNAEQLVATIGIEDAVPYNFRTAGGSADIGDREVDKIVGGTLAWNQLITSPEKSVTSNEITAVYNGSGKITLNGTAAGNVQFAVCNTYPTYITGHKYYMAGCASGGSAQTYSLRYNVNGFAETGNGIILTAVETGGSHGQIKVGTNYPVIAVINGTEIAKDFYPQIFDLTQMFGSTIADYIYSLEQATAGAGVAWFRKLFPAPYYAYNAGELMHVQTSAHKMVGFNLFNKSNYSKIDNAWFGANTPISDGSGRVVVYIPCFPNTKYCASRDAVVASDRFFIGYTNEEPALGVAVNGVVYAPTAQTVGNRMTITTTTGANAKYLVVWAYWGSTTEALDTLCINLSWDGERDGEYEPYQAWEYPLDSDLVLRGIPKLDAGNNLYYDGDTYESDGTVTRRYGVVDLGTLYWSVGIAQYSRFDCDTPTGARLPSSNNVKANIVCPKYQTAAANDLGHTDKIIYLVSSGGLRIADTDYSDAAAFKTAMSGVYLVYELATPTTEEADPYQNPQIVEDFGTEEYIDSRAVAIPVGHDTTYRANLRAKLEMSPNSPDGDGDYIVRQANGQNEYVLLTKELPAAPTSDGNYILKCTVASGAATYTWEAQT